MSRSEKQIGLENKSLGSPFGLFAFAFGYVLERSLGHLVLLCLFTCFTSVILSITTEHACGLCLNTEIAAF